MKCKVCYRGITYISHSLRQTGDPNPRSYKCPVCDTLHSDDGIPTDEYLEQLKNKKPGPYSRKRASSAYKRTRR